MKKSGTKGRMIAIASIGLMCIMALSILAPTVSAASATWEYAFPLGAGRTQALVVQDTNGVVYIAGGTADMVGPPYFDTDGLMRAYNPGTGTWATLTGMDYFVRGSSGGFGDDGRIYVISGWRTSIANPTPRVQVYNITTDIWDSTLAQIPIPVWEAKSFNTGNHFYVVGGEPIGGGHGNYTQIYNVTTDSWWVGADMPDGLTSGATVTVGGYGYYFGGVNVTDNPVADAYRYNIASDSWTKIAPIPSAMCAETAIVGQDGLVYVFGGASGAQNLPGTTYGNGYTYDIATDSWAAIDDLNVPRAWLGSALYDNKVLAIGGNDDTTAFASVEMLDTLQNQLTQANDDIAGLTGDVSALNAKNALLKEQLVNLSAKLNQTTDDLNAALNTANNKANDAKSAADSANMIGMIGIIIGIVAIVIAVIALVMKRKTPVQHMQPQPPMPPQ